MSQYCTENFKTAPYSRLKVLTSQAQAADHSFPTLYLYYTEVNGRMTDECIILNDLEESSHGLIEALT
jgi:hypothetical protein